MTKDVPVFRVVKGPENERIVVQSMYRNPVNAVSYNLLKKEWGIEPRQLRKLPYGATIYSSGLVVGPNGRILIDPR